MKEQDIVKAQQFYETLEQKLMRIPGWDDESIYKYMTSDLRIATSVLFGRIRMDLDKIYVEQVRAAKRTA